MKKSIFLIIFLQSFLFAGFGQQTVSISGTLTNLSGNAISNHTVLITSDSIYDPSNNTVWNYTNTLQTNTNGQYSVQVVVPGNSPVMFYIFTHDCNGTLHNANALSSSSPIVANFSICDSAGTTNCQASFNAYPDSSGNTWYFIDNSVGATSWFWVFGDGNTSTLQNPLHTYSQAGIYPVCLLITTANGCVDSSCTTITISPSNCSANFSYAVNSTSVNFTANAGGYPPFTYTWSFGDGSSGTGANPTHVYATAGLYIVSLSITDSMGCSATSTQQVHIPANQPCQAFYSAIPDSSNALNVYFHDLSYGNPTNWVWTFGDGSTSTAQNPSHTYSSAGDYQVCLIIGSNITACYDTFCDSVHVGGINPSCSNNFTYNIVNNSVSFSSNVTGTAPFIYNWTFGDGNTSSSANPTHTYSSVGYYLVTLTVTDTAACASTSSQYVHLSGSTNCNAQYIAVPDSSNPQMISFMDQSVGNPSVWSWSFGDGNTSSQQHPVHTYASSGYYQVCLTISSNTTGCQSTYCDTVHVGVGGPCQSSFTHTINNSTLQFSGYSSLANAVYIWDFGDGSTGTGQNVSHTYSQPGYYTICLSTSGNGVMCTPYCQTVQLNNPTSTGNIYGQVITGNNFADHAEVYLITLDSNGQILTAVDTTTIIQAGYFHFYNVPFGVYRIKAALQVQSTVYSSYLPTYHDSSLYWFHADTLNLNTSSMIANIHMTAGNNPGGPGFIGGNISQGANKLIAGNEAVPDVPILLLDEYDMPVTYTYSDVNGDYHFSNIPWGTYHIYAEMLNKTTYPISVSIQSGSDSITGVNMVVDGDNIIAGIEGSESFRESVGLIYPNPAKDKAHIDVYCISPMKLKARVYDQMGVVTDEFEVITSKGYNNIQINTQHYSSGIHFLSLETEEMYVVTRKFAIIR